MQGHEIDISQDIVFNGVDVSTGKPLPPAVSVERTARVASGGDRGSEHHSELLSWFQYLRDNHMEVAFGIDHRRLDETGWGVIFPQGAAPAVGDALAPLLEHRRAQAAREDERYFRILDVLPGESKGNFLARHGAGPGPARPDRMPYYLLIVGGPEDIPFSFQYQLDLQYAVGRICFETVEDYALYARSVVAAERGEVRRARTASIFAPANPDDKATHRSLRCLARPLVDELVSRWPAWDVERVFGGAATKEALTRVISGDGGPAVVFTASHGLGVPFGDPRQRAVQGALLCQDWPGPRQWQEAIPPEHYFAAEDVGDEIPPAGLVTFHFACYGAGTPEHDGFGHAGGDRRLAERDFVARLPQRLLAHPRGGALAVVAHVDRVWSYSFDWPRAGEQVEVFSSALGRLFHGYPVGAAMEYFNQRYAELASDLTAEIQRSKNSSAAEDLLSLSGLWTASNDARSFVVLGDPAVRLAVEPPAIED